MHLGYFFKILICMCHIPRAVIVILFPFCYRYSSLARGGYAYQLYAHGCTCKVMRLYISHSWRMGIHKWYDLNLFPLISSLEPSLLPTSFTVFSLSQSLSLPISANSRISSQIPSVRSGDLTFLKLLILFICTTCILKSSIVYYTNWWPYGSLQIPGLVNVDFADVRAIMENAGSSLMGIGTATGKFKNTLLSYL